MAVENIDIVIRETGSAAAAAGIRNVGQAAQGQAAGVNTASAAVTSYNGVLRSLVPTMGQVVGLAASLGLTLGAGALISGIKGMSDEYTTLINKLRLVSTSQDALVKTEEKLFEMSQRTRQGFADTTNFYTKLALNASTLGIEQSRLLQSTELVNMAVASSGVSAQAASAGLIQFTQGLASNRFAGEELRSVMENIPNLASQIAKGLGVGFDKFREMAKEGELTAKRVLDALDKVAPGIRKQFESMTPTLSQAFTVMRNSMLRMLGIFDQTNAVTGTLARGIIALANNLGFLAQMAGVAAVGFSALFVATQIRTAFLAMQAAIAAATTTVVVFQGVALATVTRITAMQIATGLLSFAMMGLRNAALAVWAVLLANPFTVIIAVISAAIAAVYMWGNAIKLNASGSVTALGVLVGTFRTLVSWIQQAAAWVGSMVLKLGELVVAAYNTRLGFAIMVAALGAVIAQFVILKGLALLEFLALLAVAAGRAAIAILGMSAPLLAVTAAFIIGAVAVAHFTGSLDKLIEKTKDVAKAAGSDLSKSFESATKDMKKSGLAAADLGKGFKDVEDGALGAAGGAKKAIDAIQLGGPAKAWIPEMTEELNQARDAFGNLITVQDEWLRRSGAAFNASNNAAGGPSGSGTGSGGLGGGSSGGGFSGGGSSNPFTGQTFTAGFAGGGGPFQLRTGRLTPQETSALTSTGMDVGTFQALLQAEGRIGATQVDAFNLKDFMKAQNERSQSLLKELGYTFANGGSFIVGGNASGVDNQLVQFMATPGERVTIQNTSQQRAQQGGTRVEAPVYVNINVKANDVESFRRTEDQLVAQLAGKLKRVNRRSAGA